MQRERLLRVFFPKLSIGVQWNSKKLLGEMSKFIEFFIFYYLVSHLLLFAFLSWLKLRFKALLPVRLVAVAPADRRVGLRPGSTAGFAPDRRSSRSRPAAESAGSRRRPRCGEGHWRKLKWEKSFNCFGGFKAMICMPLVLLKIHWSWMSEHNSDNTRTANLKQDLLGKYIGERI